MTQPEQPYARYRLEPWMEGWVDMPEARPRARARMTGTEGTHWVDIAKNGDLTYNPDEVEIDTYQGEGYEAIRAEGEAYWARRDANDSNLNEEE